MTDVTLPSLGESVTEGIITQWFKKVGDVVARDEPLFEVSTDKVDSEMPSPASGVLVEILAAEGDTVQTGSRVAVIDDTASAGSASQSATPTPVSETVAASPAPPAQPIAESKPAPTPTPASPPPAPTPAPAPTSTAPVRSRRPPLTTEPGVVVSPVVRRILSDGGVEASTVLGTGPGGAITRRDAERAVVRGSERGSRVPLSNGRRRMGQHMSVSSQSTPHGFVALEVDGAVFGELDALGRETRDGEPISDEMVVSLAAVRALGEFDFLNATYAGDEWCSIHREPRRRARVADDGMLVPVVHAAAGLTFAPGAADQRT